MLRNRSVSLLLALLITIGTMTVVHSQGIVQQSRIKTCLDEDEQGIPLRKSLLGDRCRYSSDCSNRYFMRCLDGKCACEIGMYSSSKYLCETGPPLNAPCIQNTCQYPYVCNNESGRCDCPLGMKKTAYNLTITCECDAGMLRVEQQCLQPARLNQACKLHIQCKPAFSYCVNDTCNCKEGTQQKGATCEPIEYSCLHGQPLRVNDEMYKCKYNVEALLTPAEFRQRDTKQDTCPTGYYCNYLDANSRAGFCCPVLPSDVVKCPVGKPYAYEGSSCVNEGHDRNCPTVTHFCYLYQISGFSHSLCCPRVCPPHSIERMGQCYTLDPALWATNLPGGEMPCEVDEQCSFDGNQAMCSGSRCRCKPGYRFAATYSSQRWCIKLCNSSQVWKANDCLPLRSVGESCSASEQCTSGSYCKPSSQLCECRCDQILDSTSNSCVESNANRSLVKSCTTNEDCPQNSMCSTNGMCREI